MGKKILKKIIFHLIFISNVSAQSDFIFDNNFCKTENLNGSILGALSHFDEYYSGNYNRYLLIKRENRIAEFFYRDFREQLCILKSSGITIDNSFNDLDDYGKFKFIFENFKKLELKNQKTIFNINPSSDLVLSNSNYFDLLSLEAKKFIKEKALPLEKKFNSEVYDGIEDTTFTERYNCRSTYNRDDYTNIILSMNNPTQSEANAVKAMISYQRCDSREVKGIKIDFDNRVIKYLTTSWENYLKYHGNGTIDYVIIAEKNLKKSDLKKYNLKAKIYDGILAKTSERHKYKLKIIFTDQNDETPSDEVLNYFGLDSPVQSIKVELINYYGIDSSMQSMKKDLKSKYINFGDIYKWNEYLKNESTKSKIPQLKFKIENISPYMENDTLKLPLWKIESFVQKSDAYANAIKIIVDEALEKYHNTLSAKAVSVAFDKEGNLLNGSKVEVEDDGRIKHTKAKGGKITSIKMSYELRGPTYYHIKFKNGVVEDAKEWYKDGQLKVQAYFVNGVQVLRKEFYQNGNMKYQYSYLDGEFLGEVKNFYKNGQLEDHTFVLNDLAHGPYKLFDENGILKEHLFYKYNPESRRYVKNNLLTEN